MQLKMVYIQLISSINDDGDDDDDDEFAFNDVSTHEGQLCKMMY